LAALRISVRITVYAPGRIKELIIKEEEAFILKSKNTKKKM